MKSEVIALGIILLIEIIGLVVFIVLAKWSSKGGNENKINARSVVKGIIERAFITFTLLIAIPQAITVFAALKIATRIKDDDKISNDFYLIGNLISITMAIAYTYIIREFFNL